MRRDSAAMRNHQKADDGDVKLDRGIVARFGDVTDLETFWYAAQVVQARAIRTGVEHYRSLRPYCMGTIWWQLNDCWPVDELGGRRRRRAPQAGVVRAARRLPTAAADDPAAR